MEDFVLGMDFALMEMESATLKKIDEALHRLEEGMYGVCEECQGKIGEARLKALPFASTCVHCQERREEVEIDRPHPRSVYEEEPAPAPRGRSSARA
jgi:RNA polymerase-binding transcription factor DksA